MEVQELWEAESARIWEEICAPHPDAGKLKKAAGYIQHTIWMIGEAEESLGKAVKQISGTIGEDELSSLLNDLENLNVQINEVRRKFERGEA